MNGPVEWVNGALDKHPVLGMLIQSCVVVQVSSYVFFVYLERKSGVILWFWSGGQIR